MRISAVNNLRSTLNDLYRFEDQLNEISLKIYPSETLKELIVDEIIPVIDEIREELLREIKELESDENHVISLKAKSYLRVWSKGYLQYLARSISETNLKSYPLEIMKVFKGIIKDIDSSEFEILTSPTNQLNFTFTELWQHIRELIYNEAGISRGTDKKFIKLTFPSEHKDNVFLSGIYAHEIGHYFDRNKLLYSKIFTQNVSKNPNINNLRQFFIKHNGQQVTDSEIVTFLFDHVMSSWIKEAIADSVAVHLLGPAFIFSSSNLLISTVGKTVAHTGRIVETPSGTHPRDSLRNKFQMDTLRNLNLYDPLPEQIKKVLDDIEQDWESTLLHLQNGSAISYKNISLIINQNSLDWLESIWKDCLPLVASEVLHLVGESRMKIEHIEEAIRLAEERVKWLVPPNELDSQPVDPKSIINSGWIAKLLFEEEIIDFVKSIEGEKSEYQLINILNDLMRFALFASSIQKKWGRTRMGILTKEKIITLLNSQTPESKLIITPILDEAKQIGTSTIDLRLGTNFKVDMKTRDPFIDPIENSRPIDTFFDYTQRDFGEKFLLYPGQLVITSTFEYIRLPQNVLGYLVTRSSWDRLGINISSVVQPGYAGVLSLELLNTSSNPISIYPGLRFVQLILVVLDINGDLPGYISQSLSKYIANAEPNISNVYKDHDLVTLKKFNNL